MELRADHPFYTASNDIAEIVKPLRTLGITYYTYGRSYHDGSRVFLQDGNNGLDIYLKEKHYLTGNTEYHPKYYTDQAILWSTVPNQKVISACARASGYDHGMFIFNSHEDYCEVISVATDKGNDRIINTYLTNMDFIFKFNKYFREKASYIIDLAEKQKFVLPYRSDKPRFISDMAKIKDELLNLQSSKSLKLSAREHQCCTLLIKGNTAAQIAATLNLSNRTVEYYLSNIKNKLNCKNKAELISKLVSTSIGNIGG